MALLGILALPTGSSRIAAQSESPKLEISGIVMIVGSRKTVPGAHVELQKVVPQTISFPTRAAKALATIIADSKGAFSFRGLEPGDYQLLAKFPESGLQAGRQPRLRTLTLTKSGSPQSVELWLTPTSTVSGLVVGRNAQPLAGFRVQLARVVWDGGPTLEGVPGSTQDETDSTGRYRISTPPGEFILAVLPPPGSSGLQTQLFYPGSINPEDAIPFTVQEGSDLGLNVSVPRTDQLRVRFEFALPENLPDVSEPLSSFGSQAELVTASLLPLGRGTIRRKSYELKLENLKGNTWITPPLYFGEYELRLNYSTALVSAIRTKRKGDIDWDKLNPVASFRINVDGRDDTDRDKIVDLGQILPDTKVTIPGLILLKNAPSGNFDFTKIRFFLRDTTFRFARRVTPTSDGIFKVESVHPGLFEVFPPVTTWDLPQGYYVSSIIAGRDVLNDGLLVDGQAVNPVQIVIQDDAGTLGGTVMQMGRIVPDARVVLIPPASRRGMFTRFPTTAADTSGVFLLSRVPPGEYRLLALDVAGQAETRPLDGTAIPFWESSKFLTEFELRGESITVRSKGKVAVNPEALRLRK